MSFRYQILTLLFIPLWLSANDSKWLDGVTPDGAPYVLLEPKTKSNNELVVWLPGYRPDGFTRAVDLNPNDEAIAYLLKNGFSVASTSYRRNGLVVQDGMIDALQLIELLKAKNNYLKTWIIGISMGAEITVNLSQEDTPLHSGAIVIGFPNIKKTVFEDIKASDKAFPKVPLLFLVNQSESSHSEAYAETYKDHQPSPSIWIVRRDGHVNIRDVEIIRAFESLKDSAPDSPPSGMDGTMINLTPRSGADWVDQTTFECSVTQIDPVYGNVDLFCTMVDFAKMNLKKGDRFMLAYENRSVTVLLGNTFSDVEPGEWVAFPNADGQLRLSRNFANAAKSLNLNINSRVRIQNISASQ